MSQPLLHHNDIVVALKQMKSDRMTVDVWCDAATVERWTGLDGLAGQVFDPSTNAEARHRLAFHVQEKMVGLNARLLAELDIAGYRSNVDA